MKNSQKIILALIVIAIAGLSIFAFSSLSNSNPTNNNPQSDNNSNTGNNTNNPSIDNNPNPTVNNPDDNSNPGTGSNNNQPQIVTVEGTFADLIKQGKNYSCSFSVFQNNKNNNGTAYVSRDRIRFDYTSSEPNITANVSMIRDGSRTHIWSGNSGLKFNNSDLDSNALLSEEPSVNPINSNKDIKYTCQDWKFNEKFFQLPADVSFAEINSISNNIQSQIDNITNSTNSEIDKLTQEAVQLCLQERFQDPEITEQDCRDLSQ